MFKFHLTHCVFGFVFWTGGTNVKNLEELPSWIIKNPSFQNQSKRDSVKTGYGFINLKGIGNQSWLILLNEKAGHGIEIELQKLSLNPDLNDFLLISAWPLTSDFKQIKLFTGNFDSPLKKLRIPNTKIFYVLYSASSNTILPEMALTYRRYGISFEVTNPPTDNPTKKKETVFEIQLKGKSPHAYSISEFLAQVKEAIRASARRYCKANKIPFNNSISTQEMVSINRISFCPFEWPQRQICASMEHSIFVSGGRTPEEFILDYQLTAYHLKKMWNKEEFQELQELGITVFELPSTYSTIVYWCLIIGLMIISTLIGTMSFWKANHADQISLRPNSITLEEAKKTKKPKLKLAKHQRVPSFMYANGTNGTKTQTEKLGEPDIVSAKEQILLKEKFEDILKPGDSSGLPIKNYFGSILFSSNKAFEDDEDDSVKPRRESP